ncbi:MAG TPA: carboxymuconolactone decarboxylase family protein [Longimicrobium sp.]|jgi:AhpD family alkylhydroperoxidase|uniref:carboxymuconolactone decarboxylase family protein n=1 Tax=Longimicrobium sp. TaxID=2029185 RepID=UPI002EDAF9C9
MPRITPLSGNRAGLLGRLMNAAARWREGRDFTPLQIVAHSPPMLLPYVQMSAFSQGRTLLSPQVRALAMHLAAHLNGCAWCMDYGEHLGTRAGVPAQKLSNVHAYAADPAFSPADRAALAFAEEMTMVGGRVTDETFAELRRHFSEREVVELTLAVAAENFFNRMNAALGVEEQGFCALPGSRAPAGAADGA